MQNSGCHGNQRKISCQKLQGLFEYNLVQKVFGLPLYQSCPHYFDWLKNMATTGGMVSFSHVYIGKPCLKPQGLYRALIFIPRHTLVSGYYVIPFGVCLSVRPSVRAHHFRSITWVFIHGIFSNFAYILLSAMSGMGLLMGKIRPFLTELLPFFVLEKWFLACYSFSVHDIWMKLHRYVAHQRLHILTKDRHSDLPSLWVIHPW